MTIIRTQTDTSHLASALAITARTVSELAPGDLSRPTPCPELTVEGLLQHLTDTTIRFADLVLPDEDPGEESYLHAARRLLAGYEAGPPEGATDIGVILMDTIAHGWDLAVATGRRAPYPAEASEAGLEAGRRMLKPEFRGPGQPFAAEVPVAETAPAIDRLMGFLGRDPGWRAA